MGYSSGSCKSVFLGQGKSNLVQRGFAEEWVARGIIGVFNKALVITANNGVPISQINAEISVSKTAGGVGERNCFY